MTSQRGVALILALLFLSFLTVLGGALLTTSTIDVWISDNYKTGIQSLYLAEAGIDHARDILRTSPSTPTQWLATAAGEDGVLSTSTDPAILLASDDRLLTDSSRQTFGRYQVWLRNDHGDGIASLVDTNQVLTLVSFGRIENARKVIEVTIRKAGFPTLPAGLTLNGPVAVFNSPSSLSFELDVVNIDGNSGTAPQLRTVAGLERTVAGITANATDIFNPPFGAAQTIGNYGSATDYRIAVVNGDVNLGPGVGYGMLVVRGDATITGNFSWNGLVLVIGQGVLHWNGGNYGSITGGAFFARTHANDRSLASPLGTILGAKGSLTVDLNGANGSGIHYNPAAVFAANQSLPYVPIAIRER